LRQRKGFAIHLILHYSLQQ
jgi:hypothetical protein